MAASEAILRLSQDLPQHPNLPQEHILTLLLQATEVAHKFPFIYDYIDKPQDGYLVFIYTISNTLPRDGIRWQESEQSWVVSAGPGRRMQITEQKYGFVPQSRETAASRMRRRYRLVEGGDPSLALIHYTRGQPVAIVPSYLHQAVRQYPLPDLSSQPGVYVVGEKRGQRVYRDGPVGTAGSMGTAQGHAPGAPMTQRAMMDRRNAEAAERERAQRAAAAARAPPTIEEDTSDHDSEHATMRALAQARYRRNHDLMHEVFMHAAFGDNLDYPPPKVFAGFKKEQIDEKVEKVRVEIAELEKRKAERREARERVSIASAEASFGVGDVSMESVSAAILAGSSGMAMVN